MSDESRVLLDMATLADAYGEEVRARKLRGSAKHIEDLELQILNLENKLRDKKIEAANNQLTAGRYQFMWEAAQLCINKIDDWFEYAYLMGTLEQAQAQVRSHLATYTETVKKLKNRKPQ